LTTNFGKGRTHDFDIFKTNKRTLTALSQSKKLGDKAYISKTHKDSHQIQTPHKRPRSKNKKGSGLGSPEQSLATTKSNPQPQKTKLTKEQKAFNKAFSKIRIGIEHTFAHFKKFQILSKPYRNRRKRFGLRFNLIAGIYNFELDIEVF
jgi:hypothetical protein